MTTEEPIRLVENPQAIRTLIDIIKDEDCVAIDTEFHSERRYYPELMLVQLCTRDGRTWVVDPQSVEVAALFEVLASTNLLVHSGEQDLAILLRECNTPALRVFDVQIAAGLCGHGYPTRLDTLVSEILGTNIDKGPTLSDWSKRPLTPKQVAYAASDVRVLFPLQAALIDRLNDASRLPWADHESQQMALQVSQGPSVRHTWTDWDITPRLDPTTQNVLGVLFHWRDQQGRQKNQPPFFILSDGLCLDIARRKPQSIESLSENRRIPQGLIRRLGKEICGVVSWACDNEADLPFVPTAEHQKQAKVLSLWNDAFSKSLGVAPSLLLSGPLILDIVIQGVDALNGWKKDAIEPQLSNFLTGEEGLFFGPKGAEIRSP